MEWKTSIMWLMGRAAMVGLIVATGAVFAKFNSVTCIVRKRV